MGTKDWDVCPEKEDISFWNESQFEAALLEGWIIVPQRELDKGRDLPKPRRWVMVNSNVLHMMRMCYKIPDKHWYAIIISVVIDQHLRGTLMPLKDFLKLSDKRAECIHMAWIHSSPYDKEFFNDLVVDVKEE